MTPIDQARIDANWRAVQARLDCPTLSRPERALRALHLPPTYVRLALATPSLRRAWLVSSAIAVLFGLAAADPARPRESAFTFLLLAPLVPAVGVALSYGPGVDPAYEVTLSTPRSGLRLVLVRTVTVLVSSLFVLSLVSLLLPTRAETAFGWLLPSMTLCSLCLALMTVTGPRVAAALVSLSWMILGAVVNRAADDALDLFGGRAAWGYVACGVAAWIAVIARRGRFSRLLES